MPKPFESPRGGYPYHDLTPSVASTISKLQWRLYGFGVNECKLDHALRLWNFSNCRMFSSFLTNLLARSLDIPEGGVSRIVLCRRSATSLY